NHDVHLGVPEEPEDVLEQYRVAAASSIKETGTEVDIHQHHGHHTREYRHDRNQQVCSHQPGPHKQRHLHQRHTGSAHVEDGGDDVDRAHDRARTHDMDCKDKESHAGRCVGGGERGVEGPAEVGRTAFHEQR